MFKAIPTVVAVLLATAVAPALAQSTAPGLWQIENKMGGNPEMERAMAQMQAQMAAMPPAQRKQMEAMMAQNGMSIGAGAGGAMAIKMCITPEMAAKQQLPTQTEGDCTSKIGSRSGNTMGFSFTCTKPPSSGEGSYTFSGDKAYTMKMAIRSVQDGKPQNLTMNAKAQWLSGDCGSIKPITLPTK
ncbi:MAG: DUF3617 domain-containing protein [Hydrogenophaga sp.]